MVAKVSLYLTGIFLLFLAPKVQAQFYNPYQHDYQGWDGNTIKRSPIRAFLNKFSVTLSTGYGRTFYSHKLSSDVLETPNGLVLLGNYSVTPDSVHYSGVTNWLNAPKTVQKAALYDSAYRLLSQDSATIGYAGIGTSIPIRLTLTYDFKRFRIGGGFIYEFHHVQPMNPLEIGTMPYQPNFSSTSFKRYFFTMSSEVYNLKGWTYNVDIEIGKVIYGKAYDKASLQHGIYFNLGIPIEYELSEYCGFFVRPSFDFKNYTINLPGSEPGLPASVQHKQPALYVNFGFRIKYPEIPRCPIKSCHTQVKHVHFNKEYRGQPFYKKQNPKIGELYPKLLRYKSKNRRKINGGY